VAFSIVDITFCDPKKSLLRLKLTVLNAHLWQDNRGLLSQLVEEEVGLWTTDVGDEQITSSKVCSSFACSSIQTMRAEIYLLYDDCQSLEGNVNNIDSSKHPRFILMLVLRFLLDGM